MTTTNWFEELPGLSVPAWRVRLNDDHAGHEVPFDSMALMPLFGWEGAVSEGFRGVELGRLRTVLRTGIDVEPPASPIYVGDFEKSWEYGRLPKLILYLDAARLRNTYVEIPADTPEPEVQQLRRTYPTLLTSTDGSMLWLSRLSEDDRGLGSPYEAVYARWIPENPVGALLGLLIFARPQDEPLVATILAAAESD